MASIVTVQIAAGIAPAEEEQQLVDRAKGDANTLAALYRMHYAAIYSYVFRRVGSRHETDDLVGEVFLAMVRYLPRYRWTGAPFRSWLYRLATTQVNRWARGRRRWARQLLTSQSRAEVEPTTDVKTDVDVERIRLALLTLAPRFQAALSLHYFEDMSIAEIATVLGCREGTVKSRLSRGRDALRILLTKYEENPHESGS